MRTKYNSTCVWGSHCDAHCFVCSSDLLINLFKRSSLLIPKLVFPAYYRLNMFILPKFLYWSPNMQWWWDLEMGLWKAIRGMYVRSPEWDSHPELVAIWEETWFLHGPSHSLVHVGQNNRSCFNISDGLGVYVFEGPGLSLSSRMHVQQTGSPRFNPSTNRKLRS